jgi:hypothetical protein
MKPLLFFFALLPAFGMAQTQQQPQTKKPPTISAPVRPTEAQCVQMPVAKPVLNDTTTLTIQPIYNDRKRSN